MSWCPYFIAIHTHGWRKITHNSMYRHTLNAGRYQSVARVNRIEKLIFVWSVFWHFSYWHGSIFIRKWLFENSISPHTFHIAALRLSFQEPKPKLAPEVAQSETLPEPNGRIQMKASNSIYQDDFKFNVGVTLFQTNELFFPIPIVEINEVELLAAVYGKLFHTIII